MNVDVATSGTNTHPHLEHWLMQAIQHNNLEVPDFPFDLDRFNKADDFAHRIMSIIEHYCSGAGVTYAALVAAAYVANARLVVDEKQEIGQ